MYQERLVRPMYSLLSLAFDSEWDKNTKGLNPSWRGIVVIIIVIAIWLVIR